MLRMFARRMSQIRTTSGADQVMVGWSLPSDTVLHDIRLKVQMVGLTSRLLHGASHMFAVEGWILPVLDPDSGATYDTLWDQLVPKDTDVQTIDLDTEAADTTPFYEPGEADWSAVLDVGLRPQRLYHRHALITEASPGQMVSYDTQTPFNIVWSARQNFKIQVRKRLRVRQPSALVFAIASPALDDTTGVVAGMLEEAEWAQVKYSGNLLERALLHLFGVVEAGAETPWEEATALLQKHLDPDLYEETAGKFGLETYDVYSEAMLDHSVVGEVAVGSISTGR